MKTIAYLGPESSYSFLAAQKAAEKGDTLIGLPTFSDVFNAVRVGSADSAVIPIENSVEGNVNEVTDCLIFGPGQSPDDAPLFINAEFVLTIENYLIALKGAALEGIKTIATHWQPYAQCRQSLKKLLPNAKIAFADSTSAAVASLKDGEAAALGGKQLITEKHAALGPTVNDVEGNCTRFALLSAEDREAPENNKLTIVFEAENRPGGLLRLLEIINVFGMNMTRIESRPHKSVLGRYVFIVDLNGNILDNNTASALELIKRSTIFFKYIGNYREL
jgi:prephenate dehydratase